MIQYIDKDINFVKIFSTHDYSDFLKVNSGVSLQGGMIGSQIYVENAIIPNQDWRIPSSNEVAYITSNSIENVNTLSIINIPEIYMNNLKKGIMYHDVFSEPEINYTIVRENAKILGEYLKERYNSNELVVHGLHIDKPNLLTGTIDPSINKHLGIHLDSWDKLPLSKRYLAMNRISVNLGTNDRFFLYYNISIDAIATLLDIPKLMIDRISTNMLKSMFAERYPNYPLIKLRIRPGEAYVAPTDFILHDCTSMGLEKYGAHFTYRGRFIL